jgi:hypothetical protein
VPQESAARHDRKPGRPSAGENRQECQRASGPKCQRASPPANSMVPGPARQGAGGPTAEMNRTARRCGPPPLTPAPAGAVRRVRPSAVWRAPSVRPRSGRRRRALLQSTPGPGGETAWSWRPLGTLAGNLAANRSPHRSSTYAPPPGCRPACHRKGQARFFANSWPHFLILPLTIRTTRGAKRRPGPQRARLNAIMDQSTEPPQTPWHRLALPDAAERKQPPPDAEFGPLIAWHRDKPRRWLWTPSSGTVK